MALEHMARAILLDPASLEADLSKYVCEKCGAQGVCEDGMDVFVALLCQPCFDREWQGYIAAVTQPEESLYYVEC